MSTLPTRPRVESLAAARLLPAAPVPAPPHRCDHRRGIPRSVAYGGDFPHPDERDPA